MRTPIRATPKKNHRGAARPSDASSSLDARALVSRARRLCCRPTDDDDDDDAPRIAHRASPTA